MNAERMMELMERLNALERRVAELEAREAGVTYVDDNVSNPPTDAELDTAFGGPGDVGTDFVGVVNDAGAGANVWLVASDGTSWWYEALTKAT